jgi:DNA polymerase-1
MSPNQARRMLIVDGHAYAYRAFHAIRSLNSPSGVPTNAVFGFIKMTQKMRALLEPQAPDSFWFA